MRGKKLFVLITGICLIFIFLALPFIEACGQPKITVLNPLGQPPPITLIPMAPRLDTLDGKTIYIVDVKYPLTSQFFQEMEKVLVERYPEVNWVLKEKAGTYFDDDPRLWAEIKEKGDAAIMGIGH